MTKILGFCFYLLMSCSMAQSITPAHFTVDDTASLQRGAAIYMNYCSGCHSLNYLRYNQMAKGLGINSSIVLKNNLIFTQANSSDPITIALPQEDAQQWFGLVPPDLSLVARKRGAFWLYQYLMGFYHDKERPFGVNNTVVPNVAMPDVLEPLRGQMRLDNKKHVPVLIKKGALDQKDFDQAVADVVNFLLYVGEPTQIDRYRLGPYVLLFLILLLVPVYCLKRLYWKTIW